MSNWWESSPIAEEKTDATPAANWWDEHPTEGAQVAPKKQNTSLIGDIGTGLKRGALQIPGIATGLGDIVSAPLAAASGVRKPISKAADWLGEKTGFQPGKWAEDATAEYSPEMQQAIAHVDEAQGFFPTLKAAVEKPRSIANLVAESLPSTLVGGVAARGAMGAVMGAERLAATRIAAAAGDKAAKAALLKAGSIAGGIGEGAVTAGQQMEQTDESVNPLRAAGAALGSGIGTGILGAAGGRLATKLGLPDIDTAIAAGTLGDGVKAGATTAAKIGNTAKRMAIGGAQEGVFEEMPQSAQEQAWQNIASGKPWDEGIGEAMAQGLIAGTAMGAGVNALPRGTQTEPEQEPQPEPIAGYLPSPANTGTPSDQTLQAEVARANAVAAAQANADQIYAERDAFDKTRAINDPNIAIVPNQDGSETTIDARTGPLSSAAVSAVKNGATLRERDFVPPPSGRFGQMDELASLIDSERQDVEGQRNSLVQGQQIRRDSELESTDARVEAARIQQSNQQRDALLANVLENLPEGQNPSRAFDRALRATGFADTAFRPEEVRTIANWSNVSQAAPGPDVIPSAPNELDPEAMGIRSLDEKQKVIEANRLKFEETRRRIQAQRTGEQNGTNAAATAIPEAAAPSLEVGRGELPGSGTVLAPAPVSDTGRASNRAEMAGSSVRPAMATGSAGAPSLNINPQGISNVIEADQTIEGQAQRTETQPAAAVAPVRGYPKGQAQMLANRLTHQAMPSEIYPHPTEPGKFAIRPQGSVEADDAAMREAAKKADDEAQRKTDLVRQVRQNGAAEMVPPVATEHRRIAAQLEDKSARSLTPRQELDLLDGQRKAAVELARLGWTNEQIAANSLNMTVQRYQEQVRGGTVGKDYGLTDETKQLLDAARQGGTTPALPEPPARRPIKPVTAPIMRRNDLVGAIMRATGGRGIHSNMATTLVGDTANNATRVRGLFTNQGQQDMDDLAMLLREQEGFDVRDASHLEDLVREAAAGNVAKSMERQEQEKQAEAEKQHRDNVRQKAKSYGIKTVARKFEDITKDVAAHKMAEQQQAEDEAILEREAIQAAASEAVSDETINELARLAADHEGRYINEEWISNDEILNAFEPIGEGSEEQAIDGAGEAVTGETGGSDPQRSEETRPDLALQGQTPAEVRAQEAQRKAEEEAANKPAPDNSPRVKADQVDLFNTQGGLFNSNREEPSATPVEVDRYESGRIDSATKSVSLTKESAREVRIGRIVSSQSNPADKARKRGFYDEMLGFTSSRGEFNNRTVVSYDEGVSRAKWLRGVLKGKNWYETEKEKDGSKWKWSLYREGFFVANGEARSEKEADKAAESAKMDDLDRSESPQQSADLPSVETAFAPVASTEQAQPQQTPLQKLIAANKQKKADENATRAAKLAELMAKRKAEKAKTEYKSPIDALNDDNSDAAITIVQNMKGAELKALGEQIGFRQQYQELVGAYRDRLIKALPDMTRTKRETFARQKKVFDRILSLAMDYDRMMDWTGAPEGQYDGKWMTHQEAKQHLVAELNSLRNNPDYDEMAGRVSQARPRIFDAADETADKNTGKQDTSAERAKEQLSQLAQNATPKASEQAQENSAIATPESITEKADSIEPAKVEDFGEKIGGARKDKAVPLGPRNRIAKEEDNRPAWARKFHLMQIQTMPGRIGQQNVGKWQIMEETGGAKGAVRRAFSDVFDTEQEGLDALPRLVAGRKHRIYGYKKNGENLFGIFRTVTDRKRALVRGGFKTIEEAGAALDADPVGIIEHKFAFPERPWLDKIERIGNARISGNVTTKMFQDTFGFRGGEFGNWNMGGDGQAALNHAYEALLDLAEAIGVPPKALSLNGELAIAFGARGTGGVNSAAAHYEPDSVVINLTKIKGAGSLAHELWHAMDHYFARNSGRGDSISVVSSGYAYNTTARPELVEAFKSLTDAINYSERSTTTDADLVRKNAEKRIADARRNLDYQLSGLRGDLVDNKYRNKKTVANETQLKQWDDLVEKLREGDEGESVYIENPSKMRGAFGFTTGTNIRDLNALYKQIVGRSFLRQDPQSTGRTMQWNVKAIADNKSRLNVQDDVTTTSKGRSEFYTEARLIDQQRTGDYWSSPHEMGARAFESYIFDKISGAGNRSDYLVYAVENRYYSALDMKPYPEGSERQRINDAFENLFQTVQTKETEKGAALYSKGSEPVTTPMPQPAAETRIKSLLGDKLGKVLIDSGIVSFVHQGSKFDGATYSSGNIVLNLDALNDELIDGIVAHEGFHSTVKELVGEETYTQLMAQLEKLTAANTPWANEARAAVPADTKAGDVTEEIAAYAVQQHMSGAKMSPFLKRWASSFLSALRTAIIRRLPFGKLKAWAVKNVQPQDLARLAMTGLKAKAQGRLQQGREAVAYSRERKTPQTETVAFRKWFGDSKVVDAAGKPLVVYHGTMDDVEAFDENKGYKADPGWLGRGFYFTTNTDTARYYATNAKVGKADPNIMPVFLSLKNPYYATTKDKEHGALQSFGNKSDFAIARRKELIEQGYDGVILDFSKGGWAQEKEIVVFHPEQIKSATGNNGDFDSANPDIRYSKSTVIGDSAWSASEPSKMDDVIYALQDKHIDTRRVLQSILKTGRKIHDNFNPYLQEELFHGRAAKGVKEFLDTELRPLLADMQRNNVDMGDFEEYLWNRHAPERNAQIAKINPEMKDGGSGIKTADARAYLNGLSTEKKAVFESLSKRIDAINRSTQAVLVESGLEKQETIDAWNSAYKHYVPLQREDVDSGHIGTGRGFSIRGSSSKRAMGSGKQVVDIIANITMQRERNIVRAEKNRVSNALMGLALQNPNEDFWQVDKAPKERVVQEKAIYTVLDADGNKVDEFTRMADAEKALKTVPGGEIDQTWGERVEERIQPGFKNQDNVILTRVNGEDHYITFNERDTRAMRMASALKNLDADGLGRVLSIVGKATRYLASVNTQYNPVFGVINLIRDAQGAMINLSSTPLAGEQKRVLGYTKDALVGIYKDIRDHRAGKKPSSNWAELFDEFQREGGQTGYRDQYANTEQRAEAIHSELKQFKEGSFKKLARGVFGWLSDYNETMENAVRLSAYKAAKEKGMSKQQAASLAKNITVNFNRKGQMATQVGALYAFFNASVQGSARMAETLFESNDGDVKSIRLSKLGKKIITGGIMLGSMQAMLLAAAGYDDDEPPDFVRERNLILPIGDGKYLTLAMPLGFHVIPGIGRIATEFVLSGGKDPLKRIAAFASMFADTFNPIGNAGFSLQSITPSVVDPFAALAENKDFTGKEIYRNNFNSLNPQTGNARAKDVATFYSKLISASLNWITGGSEFRPGMLSPSPDAIDYLIGQATGGVGREVNKVIQTGGATLSGEDLPLYKVPLVGRFVGDTEGQSGQSQKFYEGIRQLNMLETERKGLLNSGRGQEVAEFSKENPGVRMILMGNRAEKEVRDLRTQKRNLMKRNASTDEIRRIDERITERMRRFNEQAASVI